MAIKQAIPSKRSFLKFSESATSPTRKRKEEFDRVLARFISSAEESSPSTSIPFRDKNREKTPCPQAKSIILSPFLAFSIFRTPGIIISFWKSVPCEPTKESYQRDAWSHKVMFFVEGFLTLFFLLFSSFLFKIFSLLKVLALWFFHLNVKEDYLKFNDIWLVIQSLGLFID